MESSTPEIESDRPHEPTVAPHRRLARRWRGGGPGIGTPVYRKRRLWPEAVGLSVLCTGYLVAHYVPGSSTPIRPGRLGWMGWGVWGILAFYALWIASTPYTDSAIGRRLKGAAILFGVAPILAHVAGWI